MEHKRPNYVHISTLYRQTTFMFICQTVNSDRFLKTLLCSRSFTSLLQVGSLNTLQTLPVEKDCVRKAKPRGGGEGEGEEGEGEGEGRRRKEKEGEGRRRKEKEGEGEGEGEEEQEQE